VLAAQLLRAAGPSRQTLAAVLQDPQGVVDRQGADALAVSVAGVAGWVLLAWLTLAMGLLAVGALPGATGRLAERLSRLVAPAALRRVLAVGLGVGLATGLGAGVATAGTHHRPRPAPVIADLDWPVPAARPATTHSAAAPARASRAPVAASPAATVLVHPGDTLWDIAAARLGTAATDAQISAEWQRWYAVNRAVVGPDPDLLLPGQRLQRPPGEGGRR
jgi:hypothetical protein